jgi:RecA/RadA recombinase
MAAKKKKAKKKAGTKKAKKPKALSDEELVIPQVAGTSIAPAAQGPSGAVLHTAMREFIASENSQYDDHKVIEFASNVPNTYELRRPSGIMQLDLDTGGGPPAGGLTYISGPDNAGKTFLILLYMLMHQRLYGDQSSLAFACVEGGFDFKRALNMGLKISVPDPTIAQWDQERQARGFPPYTKEEWQSFKQQTGEFVIIGGPTGEAIMQTALNCIRSRLFGIVAVDSVSILLPEADAGKDIEEHEKRAANASLITKFIKQYTPLTSGLDGLNWTTLLFSAQVRSNSAKATAPANMQKYLKDWASTGAYAGKHGKLLDICVWSGAKIDRQVQGKRVVVGKQTKYELLKGKAGAHDNVTGEFPFYYDFFYPAGVDQLDTVIAQGMKRGVIVENPKTSKVDVIQPDTGQLSEIRNIPGMRNFRRMMEIDIDFELAVRREILASKGIMCLYR